VTLHDLIKQDAESVFCNADDFAESIVYYKRNGRSREIKAVVTRTNAAILPEGSDLNTPVFEIAVPNDQSSGIASDELDLGGDEIGLSPRVGQPVSRRSIVRLLEHDEGMLLLECR
jgi:hypothetical protein